MTKEIKLKTNLICHFFHYRPQHYHQSSRKIFILNVMISCWVLVLNYNILMSVSMSQLVRNTFLFTFSVVPMPSNHCF